MGPLKRVGGPTPKTSQPPKATVVGGKNEADINQVTEPKQSPAYWWLGGRKYRRDALTFARGIAREEFHRPLREFRSGETDKPPELVKALRAQIDAEAERRAAEKLDIEIERTAAALKAGLASRVGGAL